MPSRTPVVISIQDAESIAVSVRSVSWAACLHSNTLSVTGKAGACTNYTVC